MCPTDDKKSERPEPPCWSYSGETGPEKWGELMPEYALACNGKEQSPVDISAPVEKELPPLALSYKVCSANPVYTGRMLYFELSEAGTIAFEGETYELRSFHFHRPAEHTVEGSNFDAEAHLVHKDGDGTLLVLGFFLKLGEESEAIGSVFNNRGEAEFSLDPATLLPPLDGFYTYEGSLTTPPCTEGVTWLILKDILYISAAQLSLLTGNYGTNSRPLQPLNHRVVVSSA